MSSVLVVKYLISDSSATSLLSPSLVTLTALTIYEGSPDCFSGFAPPSLSFCAKPGRDLLSLTMDGSSVNIPNK